MNSFYDVGYYAPNIKGDISTDFNGFVFWVFGHQVNFIIFLFDAFYRKLPIHEADGYTAIVCLDAAVNDQKVAIVHARPLHGISVHTGEKGGIGVVDKLSIQRNTIFFEIISG